MDKSDYKYTFNYDLMNEVETYVKEGHHKKAIDLLSRAIENNPENVDVIVKRGDIYAQSGRHRLAVKDYTRAIKLKSDNTRVYLYYNRSKAYNRLGEYKHAVSDLKSALRIKSLAMTGPAIINVENYVYGGMQQCIGAIKSDPQRLEYCFRLVLASNDEKDCQASVNFLSKVIEFKPEYASRAYCVRAYLYVLRVKNYQQAIEDYSKGIALDLHYPQTERIGCSDGYSGRAHAYYLSGQYQRAIEDYSKDIDTNPHLSSYSYSGRGDVYMKLKKYHLAIQDYTRAIQTDTSQIKSIYSIVINIYSSRGDAYREVEDYQNAIQDYTTAIDLSLKEATTRINHTSELSTEIDEILEKSRQDVLKSQTNDPLSDRSEIPPNSVPKPISFVSPLLYTQRGDVYALSGNNQQAIKDYSKVIESDPKNAQALRKRGYVYNKLGRHKLAVHDLRMAATLGDGEAQDYLRKNEIDW